MDIPTVVLIANLFSTLFMVGLIWFVQVVHYPLFSRVHEPAFVEYQNWHQKLTTLVVGPPMLVEAFSTVLLALYPPPEIDMQLIFAGIFFLFAIWFSTAFLQIPCHGKLLKGFNEQFHRRLVLGNWVRTFAWTARGMIVCWMVISLIQR